MYKTEVTTEVLVSVEVADCCLHRKLENSNFIIIISFLSEHYDDAGTVSLRFGLRLVAWEPLPFLVHCFLAMVQYLSYYSCCS